MFTLQERVSKAWVMRYLIVGICMIPCALSLSASAESLGSMISRADAIIISVPIQKTSYWDGNIIRTRTILEVQRIVSGRVTQKEIPVVYEGGTVGSIGLKVSHGVRLPIGQKALLFLTQTAAHYSVLDQLRGVFFILPSKEGEVVIKAESLTLTPGVSIKSSLSSTTKGEGIPLKTFLSTLQTLKQQK